MFSAAWKETFTESETVVVFYCQSIFFLSDEGCVFLSFSDAGWTLIAYFLFGFLWRLAEPWHLVDFPPSFLLLLIMFKSVLSQI